jgi:hypothetical protein
MANLKDVGESDRVPRAEGGEFLWAGVTGSCALARRSMTL